MGKLLFLLFTKATIYSQFLIAAYSLGCGPYPTLIQSDSNIQRRSLCRATITQVDTSASVSSIFWLEYSLCLPVFTELWHSLNSNQMRHLAFFPLLGLIVLHASQFPSRINKVYLISCQHWLSKATMVMTVVSNHWFYLN